MAGGEGRRLKSVTGDLPKPMVSLLGKPLMERVIDLLKKCGIDEICAALRFNPAPILAHFGDGENFGVTLRWRIEETPLGTAGGVKNCMDFVGDEDFLVMSGDAACDFDLRELISDHEASGAAVTMALYEDDEPLRYGCVVPDSSGAVRGFIEKPNWERVVTDLVNTGIYVISPRAMAYVPENEPFDFAKDLFPLLMERGEQIRGVAMPGYWCDIGTPRAYHRCCLDALDGKLKLDEKPDEPRHEGVTPKRQPLEGRSCAKRKMPCANRARLMRELSAQMMEAGAALDDGVVIRSQNCALRVSPSADESALIIEAASSDEEFSQKLAQAAETLARELES